MQQHFEPTPSGESNQPTMPPLAWLGLCSSDTGTQSDHDVETRAPNIDVDVGACSAGSGAHTITLPVDVSLTEPLPDVHVDIAIQGADHITGNTASRTRATSRRAESSRQHSRASCVMSSWGSEASVVAVTDM